MFPLKQWQILNNSYQASVIDIILKNRNLSEDHLAQFKLSDRLHDPFLLQDMQKAIDRIMKAIERNERIAIFGDYDVDGIVSTALMVKLFQKLKFPVKYYLPNRSHEGYGLKSVHIEQAIKDKIDLLITVDNGISSVEEISEANNKGIEVIVTDHHIQKNELPPAHAVINPNRLQSEYPFKGLCGAGVVYKLFQALLPNLFSEPEYKNFMLTQLDMIALATIADVVPLIDENYAMVKFGLKSLTQSKRPGLVELKRIGGVLGKDISTISIGFYLAPRLNVAGRLENAEIALRLLLSESREEAASLANYLNKLNSKRQKLQEIYISQAMKIVEEKKLIDNTVIIVENEEWEPGLLGLISGKLKDILARPVVALTIDGDGNYIGSARSLSGINITDMLTPFDHLLLNFGGHQKAAGLTVSSTHYSRFKQEFTEHFNENVDVSSLKEDLVIDMVISSQQITRALVQTINKIGPFGEANPEPVLALDNVSLQRIFTLSDGKHLKFNVQKNGQSYECVWWNQGKQIQALQNTTLVDIAFKPEINIWQGRENLQLCIEDVRENKN
jgi:single-stranded-DNA-specific exonuclease